MSKSVGMILLTFREVWAKKITLGLFVVCTVLWLLMTFALNLDIVEGSLAGVRIFGKEAGPPTDTRRAESGDLVTEAISLETFVVTIESAVAGIAYWVATLLGLFAVAALLPSVLDRGHADLLFSKPMHRLTILFSHVIGVGAVGLALTTYLFGMVFFVISLKTGHWNARFLLAIPVVVSMLLAMYSVMVLVAVRTQSTALSLIFAYGLVVASLIFLAHDQLVPQINTPWRYVFLGFYHALPNFAEVTDLVAKLARNATVSQWYPYISSIVFGAVIYAAAAWSIVRRDF
jgi:ABC-type transport system involved in multi-copper enzyme maturation permease subunit